MQEFSASPSLYAQPSGLMLLRCPSRSEIIDGTALGLGLIYVTREAWLRNCNAYHQAQILP